MDHLKDPILSSLCYDGLCNTGIYIIIHNYIISCAATFNGWNLKHVDIQYLSRKAAMAGHAMLSAAHLGPVDADEDPADHLRSKWLVQDNQIFVNWYGTYFLLLYVPCCVIVLLSYYHCTHLYIRCIISLFFLLGSHLKSGVKVVARKCVSRIAMEMLRYQIDWNLEIWKNKISYIIIYHAQKITQRNAANLR